VASLNNNASEVGKAYGKRTFSLLLQPVSRGTEGAVSLEGTGWDSGPVGSPWRGRSDLLSSLVLAAFIATNLESVMLRCKPR